MDTIRVPEVCALAISRLPIVGRLIWRLTEGKHIVKLEITWLLPRSTPKRKTTNKRKSSATIDDDLDKMAEDSKMAAPTPPRLAASVNDAVCITPSPTIEARRAPPLTRPSTPTTVTDSEPTTDHSPPGEWKEVVSKKKKLLKASTPKKEEPTAQRRRTPPLEQPRKIQRTLAPRTSPPAPVPAPKPLLTQKQEEEAKCMLSGCGKSYSVHEKYDLDEVRTLRMNNGKQGTIVKAYRLPDEDGNTTEEAPAYFTNVEEQPIGFS